jgi:hypothetical protein
VDRQRPSLRAGTVYLYRWPLRKRIDTYLGGVAVGKLSTRLVRQWRAQLLGSGVSVSNAT